MEAVFAERVFVIEASQDRVWDLLGRVTIDSLDAENFEYTDESCFSAVVKSKVLFVTVPMQLQGEVVEIVPPHTLVVAQKINGMGGIVRISQKVRITTEAVDPARTRVVCKATGEMEGIVGLFLKPSVKIFAGLILAKMEKRLRELA